jgi:chromosome segregation ATPase
MNRPSIVNTMVPDLRTSVSPAAFWNAQYLEASVWQMHIPFAFWLMEALRPRLVVELGMDNGSSYFAFCQAVDKLGLEAQCFGIDTWNEFNSRTKRRSSAQEKIKAHNDSLYGAFSRLIEARPEESARHFSDGGVDLLHVGLLTGVGELERLMAAWRPKLSEKAVMLIHNTTSLVEGSGAANFYRELRAEHPGFEFAFGDGLGVVSLGERLPEKVERFFRTCETEPDKRTLTEAFGRLGRACVDAYEARHQQEKAKELASLLEKYRHELDDLKLVGERAQIELTERSQQLTQVQHEVRALVDQHALERGELAERITFLHELRTEAKTLFERALADMQAKTAEDKFASQDRERQLSELTSKIGGTTERVRTLEEELAGVSGKLAWAEGKLQSQAGDLQNALAALSDSQEEISALTEALERVRGETQENSERHGLASAGLMAEIQTWQAAYHQKEAALAIEQERVANSRSIAESAIHEQEQLASLNRQLEAECDALRTDVQLRIRQGELQLEELHQEMEAALGAEREMLAKSQERETSLRELCEEKEAALAAEREMLARSQERETTSRAMYEEREAALAAAQEALAVSRSAVESAGHEKEELASQIRHLEAEIQALRPELALRVRELAERESQIRELADRLGQLTKERDSAMLEASANSEAVSQAEGISARLAQELTERFSEIAILTRTLADQKRSAEDLAGELARQRRATQQSLDENSRQTREIEERFKEIASLTEALGSERRSHAQDLEELGERVHQVTALAEALRAERDATERQRRHSRKLEEQLQRINSEGMLSRISQGIRSRMSPAQSTLADRQLIEASRLFDASWYGPRYPRAAEFNEDLLQHFMTQGWKEGCDPGPHFSCAAYLRSNPGIEPPVGNPLLHYLKFGLKEGRKLDG